MPLKLFLERMRLFFGLKIAIENDSLNTLPYRVQYYTKLQAFLVRILERVEGKNKQRKPSIYWNQKETTWWGN